MDGQQAHQGVVVRPSAAGCAQVWLDGLLRNGHMFLERGAWGRVAIVQAANFRISWLDSE